MEIASGVDCEVAFGVLWREGSNFHLSSGGLVILQKGKTKLPKYQCVLEQESNPLSPLQVVCSYCSLREQRYDFTYIEVCLGETNCSQRTTKKRTNCNLLLRCPGLAESSQRLRLQLTKQLTGEKSPIAATSDSPQDSAPNHRRYVKTPTVPKLFMLFSTNDFRFQPWRLRVMHQGLSHILLGDKMMSSITFSITPQLFHLWYTRALCT